MFGLSSFSIMGLALVAAFGAGGTVAYRFTSAHYEHKAEKVEQAHREAVDRANVNAEAAADLYEAARSKQTVRFITKTVEVSHAIDAAPVWRDERIPDSVRDAIADAAKPDPSESSEPVSIEPASSDDERRTGESLHLRAPAATGLPSAP